jgi:hypothetical protein
MSSMRPTPSSGPHRPDGVNPRATFDDWEPAHQLCLQPATTTSRRSAQPVRMRLRSLRYRLDHGRLHVDPGFVVVPDEAARPRMSTLRGQLLCVDQVEPDEVVANGRGSLERSSQVVKRPGSSNQKRSAIVSTGWMTWADATGPSSDASTGTTPVLVVSEGHDEGASVRRGRLGLGRHGDVCVGGVGWGLGHELVGPDVGARHGPGDRGGVYDPPARRDPRQPRRRGKGTGRSCGSVGVGRRGGLPRAPAGTDGSL